MSQTVTPEEFCETLLSQLAAYERLEELAREQGQLVEAGDTEQLLVVLQRRQLYVDSVAEQETRLRPVKQDWPHSAADWPESLRARAQESLAQIKCLLEKIVEYDRRDMQALQTRSVHVGQQLNRTVADERTTRRVNQRYATSAYSTRAARLDLTR